jgi:hypothetical protein
MIVTSLGGRIFLAKGVFAITLMKRAMLLDGHWSQESKGVAAEDGSEAVAFAPNTVLLVAKNNNPRFCL